MEPQEAAFMLYTSGTTGKPKGVVHTHQAILVEHMTAKWVLDLKENDVYWCTADPGWVTGIAYEILGSWSNGASTLVYEGRFEPQKWYQLIEDYQVNVWYTAPTAIRMLAATDSQLIKKYDLTSLRHLASVGEPLNPEAVWWGLKAFGLPFHDNWWQTETGGILIANYPCMDIKPGSMGKSVPGIMAEIVDDKGKKLPIKKIGNLAIKPPWPSMMKTIWRRPQKYKSYFKGGWYITGDLAYKDKEGYFWFVGRADDVIKTSGERVGPFEVESSLIEYPGVVEAGVIGKPDPLRGEIIKAFVVLKPELRPSKALKAKLQAYVKTHLAGHAYPREIEFIDKLPKTRSGKIMRRLLKAKELGLPIGDTSTLEEF
jgi:acetyl-CoA synthetase